MDKLNFYALKYTFVLSIFLLLCVITVSVSLTVIFFSRLNSILSVHNNKMKENHNSENEPQTTWLNV